VDGCSTALLSSVRANATLLLASVVLEPCCARAANGNSKRERSWKT